MKVAGVQDVLYAQVYVKTRDGKMVAVPVYSFIFIDGKRRCGIYEG